MTKKQERRSLGSEAKRISGLAQDIKKNGMFYLRNNVTVNELQEYDSNIIANWDKEEKLYIVYYDKGNK